MKSILSSILGAGAVYAALAWRRQPAKSNEYGATFSEKPAQMLWLFKRDTFKAWVFPWAKLFRAHYEPWVGWESKDGEPPSSQAHKELFEQIQLVFTDIGMDCLVTVKGRNLGKVIGAIAESRLEGLSAPPKPASAEEQASAERVPVILAIRVEPIL